MWMRGGILYIWVVRGVEGPFLSILRQWRPKIHPQSHWRQTCEYFWSYQQMDLRRLQLLALIRHLKSCMRVIGNEWAHLRCRTNHYWEHLARGRNSLSVLTGIGIMPQLFIGCPCMEITSRYPKLPHLLCKVSCLRLKTVIWNIIVFNLISDAPSL